MVRAVLDSTVLVSAMLRPQPGGISVELLHFAAEGAYELFLSDDILDETAHTLAASKRIRRRYKYSDADIVAYCKQLARIATIISDIPEVTGIVRDPDDDMIVACAIVAKADYLVSRDKDLLALGAHEKIQVVTPEAFLHMLRDVKSR